MSSILKEPYQISVWEDELVPECKEGTEIIREHFEETRGLIIGAHDMNSKYAARNTKLTTNINGSKTLTFTMYYKFFDEDVMDFVINPLAATLTNERKVKLFFRDKWYDMVIKNCVEDSSSHSFTYTCSDIYVTELSKNGFKVELDAELENNQGTIIEVAETILEGTDWEVDPDSDIIVQTNIEPLYLGVLNQDIGVKKVNDFTPDEYADMDGGNFVKNGEVADEGMISKGEMVFFFYSDINDNKLHPQILYRPDSLVNKETKLEVYLRDINEDIITNAYNFEILDDVYYIDTNTNYNVPSIVLSENNGDFQVYNAARGEKVIKSQLTGYDPDLDKFIWKYLKIKNGEIDCDKNGEPIVYYGYYETQSLSSKLAQNFLANSDNFSTVDTGWIFDGVPSNKTTKQNSGYAGHIFTVNENNFAIDPLNPNGAQSVLVLNISGDEEWYPDVYGDYYRLSKTINGETEYYYDLLTEDTSKKYENSVRETTFLSRAQGKEGYINKTDEELEDIIQNKLRNNRYSKRERRAINTGVAANRKAIENLTPGEEFIFAASLGQYTDKEPEYKDTIRYGAKAPTELYEFYPLEEDEVKKTEALKKAYNDLVARINEAPQQFFLKDKKTGKINDSVYLETYNNYINAKLQEYKETYLAKFGFLGSFPSEETRKRWYSGGYKFRELLKDDLIGTFKEEVNSDLNKVSMDFEALYNIVLNRYSTMVSRVVKKAEETQQWYNSSFYDKMGIGEGYPSNDNFKDLAFTSNAPQNKIYNSFNEYLFGSIYLILRDKLFIAQEEGNSIFTRIETEELQSALIIAYNSAIDNCGFLDSYEYARAYKLPSVLSPAGGYKYQQFYSNWVKEAEEKAIEAVTTKGEWENRYKHPELPVDEINPPIEIIEQMLQTKKEFTEDYSPSKIGTKEYYEELYNSLKAKHLENSDYGFDFLYQLMLLFDESYDGQAFNYNYTLADQQFELTNKEQATYVAVIPNEDDQLGSHVYDEARQAIKLFNPYTDAQYATFLPYKDEDGAYVYDVFEGCYRKFRNWLSTEYRDLKTGEIVEDYDVLDKNKSCAAGDIIYHEAKFLDGHISDWKEYPTRYRMERTYENPDNRKYLEEEETINEYGHIDGEALWYPITYEAGTQLDRYEEDSNGKYILKSDLTTNDIGFSTLFKWFEFGSSTYGLRDLNNKIANGAKAVIRFIFKDSEAGDVLCDLIDLGENAGDKLEEALSGASEAAKTAIKESYNRVQQIINYASQLGKGIEDIGFSLLNGDDDNEENYLENLESVVAKKIYKDGEIVGFLPILKINKSNYHEILEKVRTGDIAQNGEVTETVSGEDVSQDDLYVKYKWYYWRHWGKPRYDFVPKICVINPSEDGETYHIYNNIKDAAVKTYAVYKISENSITSNDNKNYFTEGNKTREVAFFLTDPIESFRMMKETDFGVDKYEMEEASFMSTNHWVHINDDFRDYYRKYKKGDGEFKFGYLTPQIQTWIANKSEDEVVEGDERKFWMLYDGILIPYDERIFGLTKQYKRRRVTDATDPSKVYVLHDGIYITLQEYYKKNTFISTLDYTGLKVSFIDNYGFSAENFAIDLSETNARNKYLTFDLSKDPDGYFYNTIIDKSVVKDEVKEKWVYWIASVNKGYSLMENQLSSLGMVFEKEKNENKMNTSNSDGIEDTGYVFHGMQLFRHIPYEKKEPIIERTLLSNDELKELTNEVLGKNEAENDNEKKLLSVYCASKGYELIKENENYKLYKLTESPNIVPLVPGMAPDAKDLTVTKYFIYNPEEVEDKDSVVYDYVGQDPFNKNNQKYYKPLLDELCQKIRSIKGKESNYFKLLQDCCDTFDCWMEINVAHDDTGRIEYVEKPVYIKKDDGEDPQIYVGSLPSSENDNDYNKEYTLVPKKSIRFKRFVGKENHSGFKYGVNLKNIKRTVDSNQITSRIIVKPNKNEHAPDNFCTIQRAKQNPIKENFLYDFSYYINKGLLNYNDVIQDLYTGLFSKLNYYVKLGRLNAENDIIAKDVASLIIEQDKVNAEYETCVLGRDAALQEIEKLAQIFTQNYDTYGQIIDVPWTPRKSLEYETKSTTSSFADTFETTEIIGGVETTVTVNVAAATTEVEYPKYNETLRTYLDQMDVYQANYNIFVSRIKELEIEKERIENDINALLEREQIIINKKLELNKLFYLKYSRFIQEGSWIDEDYMDDDLYYLDALAVLRNSCVPKITYDIGVVDLYAAVEFEEDKPVLNYELGDRTFVEDVEFFGYTKNNKPYQEQIVISEKTYVLDDASQNQIKVKNYSTQFDNLFQRAAAASQTLQFNEGSYGRASSILNNDGTINQEVLQQSVNNASLLISGSVNEDVYWDHTGLTVSNALNSNVVKVVSYGILISNDGTNFKTAITGDGISADLLIAGVINTDKILIGASSTPNFMWNQIGMSAFKTQEDGIDYSTFVRFDQYGLYGIKNWSKDNKPLNEMTINDGFEPKSLKDITNNTNAVFGLTWDGFFLNTIEEGSMGRVTIGTAQDIRMSTYSYDSNLWQDQLIIGKMRDELTGDDYYGFRILNEDNEIVLDTNQKGELYLKRKLSISRFANELSYKGGLEYDDEGNIYYNEGNESQSSTNDRVTLGIVDVYDRFGGYKKVDISGVYSSEDYLTKIFSVRANGYTKLEQFTEDQLKNLIDRDGNENFAIFDNGNLYAKNAWIEGNVNAESGSIGNLLINPDGSLETKNFSLVYNTGWKISDDTSYLNNVVFKGSIKASSLEYSETQVVGGALLLRPSSTIKNYYFRTINEFITNENEVVEQNEDDTKYLVVILNSDCPFEENKYCKINSNMFNGNEKIDELDSQHSYIFKILKNKTVTSYEDSKEGHERVSTSQTALLLRLSYTEENLNKYQNFLSGIVGATIIDIGLFEDSEREIGISLNSAKDEYGYFLPQTITMFETYVQNSGYNDNEIFGTPYEWKIENKLILGRFPDEDVNNPHSIFYGRGGYGLYADNVILNGAIIIKDVINDLSAGIDTKSSFELSEIIDIDAYQNLEDTQLGKVILWAGGNQHGPNSDTPFMVDEYGTIIAKNGIFEGYIYGSTIESSKLITAQIRGKDGEGEIMGYSLEVFASQYGNETFWIGADYITQDGQHFIQDYICLNNGQLELNEVFGMYWAQAEHWGAETFDKILIGNYFTDYSENIYGEDVKNKIPNYNSHHCLLTIDEAGIGFNPRSENFDVWDPLTSIENLFFIGDSRYSSDIENIELLMGSNVKTIDNQKITKYMIGLGEDYLNLYGEVHFTTPNKAQDIKYVPVRGGYDIYIS